MLAVVSPRSELGSKASRWRPADLAPSWIIGIPTHEGLALVGDGVVRSPRWSGSHRSTGSPRLGREPLGSGRHGRPEVGPAPADRRHPRDEAVGPVGPEDPADRRHPLSTRRCAGSRGVVPVQPVHGQRHREPVLAHRDRGGRRRRAGGLRHHEPQRPPPTVQGVGARQHRPVRCQAAQASLPQPDPEGRRVPQGRLREAGSLRLGAVQRRPQPVLPGDDREGVPARGFDPVRAGGAGRHGKHQPVPPVRARVHHAVAPQARSGGILSWQRPPRDLVIALPRNDLLRARGPIGPAAEGEAAHDQPGRHRPLTVGQRSRPVTLPQKAVADRAEFAPRN